jgi:hypothetical protein
VAHSEKSPKVGSLSQVDFERISRREIERIATRDWDAMTAFWRMLPHALPSTRRRLLFHCLTVCQERGEAGHRSP